MTIQITLISCQKEKLLFFISPDISRISHPEKNDNFTYTLSQSPLLQKKFPLQRSVECHYLILRN